MARKPITPADLLGEEFDTPPPPQKLPRAKTRIKRVPGSKAKKMPQGSYLGNRDTPKLKTKKPPMSDVLQIINAPAMSANAKRTILESYGFTPGEVLELIPMERPKVADGEIDWSEQAAKADGLIDFGDKFQKTARIMSDPKPKFRDEPIRDYAVAEKHFILCVDEKKANKSIPIPDGYVDEQGIKLRHELGGFLVSDRKVVPPGWMKAPPKGTSIEVLKSKYPKVYEKFLEKKVSSL